MFDKINKWLFYFKYSTDVVLGEFVDHIWNGNELYLYINHNFFKIYRTRNTIYCRTEDDNYGLRYSGSYIRENSSPAIGIGGLWYVGDYDIRTTRTSDVSVQVPENKLLTDIQVLLTHNFSEPVVSSKKIFQDLVKKTIGKYAWCLEKVEDRVVVAESCGYTVTERFGEFKITNQHNIVTENIDDSCYISMIRWYVEKIQNRITPHVPKDVLDIKNLLDAK